MKPKGRRSCGGGGKNENRRPVPTVTQINFYFLVFICENTGRTQGIL